MVYFAWVRERLGVGEETAQLPRHLTCVADLAAWLRQRGGAWDAVFSDMARLRVAVDLTMADLDTPIVDASEIAFFPPVTGG